MDNALMGKVVDVTEKALASGALKSIPTQEEIVHHADIPFLVRIIKNLERKEKLGEKRKKTKPKDFNPFLPYEEALYVDDISETHLLLLNKFNVVNHHILIVTKAFEHQDEPLNARDFGAMWATLKEINGLAFYNGGRIAGASQPHKHLQLVPLPLMASGANMPIEAVLKPSHGRNGIETIPELGYKHAFIRINYEQITPEESVSLYQQLLSLLDLATDGIPKPYNFLGTRNWMMVVPRINECFEGVSVNALGFVGSLLVKNKELCNIIKEAGPMTVLQHVAGCT